MIFGGLDFWIRVLLGILLGCFLLVGWLWVSACVVDGWGCLVDEVFNGEFDPGSGRTLAACLTHASRAVRPLRGYTSGERVSNT